MCTAKDLTVNKFNTKIKYSHALFKPSGTPDPVETSELKTIPSIN